MPRRVPRLVSRALSSATWRLTGDSRSCARTSKRTVSCSTCADPSELRNLASERASDVERLRSRNRPFRCHHPAHRSARDGPWCGISRSPGAGEIGVLGVGPELVPLLADSRVPVRAAAARALGELQYFPALSMLERLREIDWIPWCAPKPRSLPCSWEASKQRQSVVALLSANSERRRRALNSVPSCAAQHLRLARKAHPEALPALSELARDETAPEAERMRAVVALGESHAATALEVLNRCSPKCDFVNTSPSPGKNRWAACAQRTGQTVGGRALRAGSARGGSRLGGAQRPQDSAFGVALFGHGKLGS